MNKYSNLVWIRQLMDSVDVRDAVEEEWVVCNWHDDTNPSMKVYPDGGYCFVCGKSPDALEMLTAYTGMNWKQAVDWMAANQQEEAVNYKGRGIEPLPSYLPMPWHMALVSDDAKDAWADELFQYVITERHISLHLVHDAMLGAVQGGITIPHFADGKLWNVKTRLLPPREMNGKEMKYTSIPGQKFNSLYPWDVFQKRHPRSKVVYITEGEFDALLLLSNGLPALSLPSGANTNLDEYRHQLRGMEAIFVLYDMDSAGQKAAARLPDDMPISIVTWDISHGKDVTDARQWLLPKLRRIDAQCRLSGMIP